MMSFAEFVVLNNLDIESVEQIVDAKEKFDNFEFHSWCAEKAIEYNDMAYQRGLKISEDLTMQYTKHIVRWDSIGPWAYASHKICMVEGWAWEEIDCNFNNYNLEYRFPIDEPIDAIEIDPWTTDFVNKSTGESNVPGTCHGWDEAELEEKEKYYGLISWGSHAFAEEFYDEVSWVYKVLDKYERIEGLKAWVESIDDYESVDNEEDKNLINDSHAAELYDAYDVIQTAIENGSIYNLENVETILNALFKFGKIDLKRSGFDIKLDCFGLTVYEEAPHWSFTVYRYSFLTNEWDVEYEQSILCSFDSKIPTDTVYKEIIDIILKRIKAFK